LYGAYLEGGWKGVLKLGAKGHSGDIPLPLFSAGAVFPPFMRKPERGEGGEY